MKLPTLIRSALRVCLFLFLSPLLGAQDDAQGGPIEVGTIRYLPFESDRLDRNQVENVSPAIGEIRAEKDIAVLFADALRRSFEDLQTADASTLTIDANIDHVRFNWNGLPTHPITVFVLFEVHRDGMVLASLPVEQLSLRLPEEDADEALDRTFRAASDRLSGMLRNGRVPAVEKGVVSSRAPANEKALSGENDED